jgi:hypothetical protein
MRRVSVALLAGAAIVAGALPAQAKVAGAANISGPGIGGGGISMRGDDGAGYPPMSGLLAGSDGMDQAPTKALGARYVSRYITSEPASQPPVVQYLYPYAEGGPVVYTPPGQEWMAGADGTAPTGWFRMSQGLLDALIDRGLPQQAPQPAEAPADVQGQPQSAPAAWPAGVVGAMVLLAGLLVAGALVGRRRAIVRGAA